MIKSRDWLKRNGATLLWVSVALIVGFTLGAVGYGAPYKDQLGTGLEYWLNRYQTGLSIVVAVFIARQQLNSGRQVHLSNVRLAFRHELDALQKAEKIAGQYTFYVHLLGSSNYNPAPITQSELDVIERSNNKALFNAVKLLSDIENGLKKYPDTITPELAKPSGPLGKLYQDFQRDDYKAAKDIEAEVSEHRNHLRQFMPDL